MSYFPGESPFFTDLDKTSIYEVRQRFLGGAVRNPDLLGQMADAHEDFAIVVAIVHRINLNQCCAGAGIQAAPRFAFH